MIKTYQCVLTADSQHSNAHSKCYNALLCATQVYI